MDVGDQRLVLVVEDDASIRQLISESLEQEGLHVAAACDGAEALRIAARRRPAVVVLDMGLPFVDGTTVASRIRDTHGDHVPFVIVTASRRIDEAASLVRASSYLTKPFDIADLVRAVVAAIAPAPIPNAASDEGREPFPAH